MTGFFTGGGDGAGLSDALTQLGFLNKPINFFRWRKLRLTGVDLI